jgi:hypothetical protein
MRQSSGDRRQLKGERAWGEHAPLSLGRFFSSLKESELLLKIGPLPYFMLADSASQNFTFD